MRRKEKENVPEILKALTSGYGIVLVIGEIIAIIIAVFIIKAIIARKKKADAKAKHDLDRKDAPAPTTNRTSPTANRTTPTTKRTNSTTKRTNATNSGGDETVRRYNEISERFAQNESVNQWAQKISELMCSTIKDAMTIQGDAWNQNIEVAWTLSVSGKCLTLECCHRSRTGYYKVTFKEFRLSDLMAYQMEALASVIKEKIFTTINRKITNEGLCGPIWKLSDSENRIHDLRNNEIYVLNIKFTTKNKAYVELQQW